MIRKMASKLHLPHHRAADSSSSSSAASTLSYEPRGSISTQRTSVHTQDWVKEQSEIQPMQTEELQVRRSKGSYRLSDFIIQRTLGTGSFGRVHLGELAPLPLVLLCLQEHYRAVPCIPTRTVRFTCNLFPSILSPHQPHFGSRALHHLVAAPRVSPRPAGTLLRVQNQTRTGRSP